MSTVLTAKDIEEMVAKGGDLNGLPADAVLTPSAKDAIRDAKTQAGRKTRSVGSSANSTAKPLNSKSPKPELEAYFNSPHCQSLKEQICDVGRRLWGRAYVDGNGG